MTRKGSQIRVLLLPPFRKTSKSLAWKFFCGSQNRLFEAKPKKSQFATLPPFRKAVSLITYGFLFFTVSMLKNFGTFPKHLEKMRKSVGLNPKICDMQQYVKRNVNLTAAMDIYVPASLTAGNPQTYPESARSMPRLPSGAGRFARANRFTKIFPSGFRGNFLCLREFPPPLSSPRLRPRRGPCL